SSTPSVHRADRVAASSFGKLMVLRRRRYAKMIGDPAIEIGKRASAERLLFCHRLLVAAQPCTVGLLGRRTGKRREQPEIDVHRLERARSGLDGFYVAAGDVAEQRAQRRGHGRWF